MKSVAACLPPIESRPTSNELEHDANKRSPSKARLADSQVESLWARMAAIYGHKWTSSFGDDPAGIAGETWAVFLGDLTGRQLSEGFRACIASGEEWPPSLPQYRAWCLGVPTFEAVRADFIRRALPFTRLVLSQLDGWSHVRADQREADRLLRDAYERARELRNEGEEPPPPPVAIQVAPSLVPASPEVAKAAIEEGRQLLSLSRGKDAAAGPDA